MTATAMITPYQRNWKGPSFPMIGSMLMVTLLDLFRFNMLSQKNKQKRARLRVRSGNWFLVLQAERIPRQLGRFLLAQGRAEHRVFPLSCGGAACVVSDRTSGGSPHERHLRWKENP